MVVAKLKACRAPSRSVFKFGNWSGQLLALCALLALTFLAGGTSRYDTPHIMILRPAAIFAGAFALLSFNAAHWRAYRPILSLLIAVIVLIVMHLVPLPPGIWQSLPGRDLILDIDRMAGLGGNWRPLSMFPEGTWNALYAMTVPLAVALLAAQLDEVDQVRLLVVVTFLCTTSALVGVAQASGSTLRFYRISTDAAGLFANRNHQAAMLACMFPLLAAMMLSAPAYIRNTVSVKVAIGAGLAGLIPIILVTGSRMGLVVAAMSVVCLTFMFFHSERDRNSFPLSGAAISTAGVLIIAVMIAGTVFLSRDIAIGRMSGGLEDELRIPVWLAISDFLPQYWPWGSGVGSFVPIYQVHEPNLLLMREYVNQAHNDWLDIVLTTGLPGAVLAMVALTMFVFAVRASMLVGGVSGHLRRCGAIIILILAFASIADYPLRTPILAALIVIAAIWLWSPSPKRNY